MSPQPSRLTTTPVRQVAACMCARGGACSTFAPGHAVHLIQARLVSATPAEWVDVLVGERHDDGTVIVHTLEGERIELWNGAGASDAVQPGAPVAFHPRYHVLSVGTRQFNALRLG